MRPLVDVTQRIDERPVGPYQVLVMALCALVAFLDGLDSLSIAVGAPLIVAELGLPRAFVGPVLSASLLGATAGAMTFGPLGDRFGRKRMLVVATATFGALTVLTARAGSPAELLAVRFLAGLGLGGATPCFLALSAEFAPARSRAAVASLIWAAFPVGAMTGGFINAAILRAADWRTMFLICGAMPLAVALLLAAFLPESIRFLLARGRDPRRAARIAARLIPDFPAGADILTQAQPAVRGIPVAQLFARGRAAVTLLLWVPFVMGFGTLAIVAYWTPALLRENGISAADTGFVLGVQSIGSIVGMATSGRLLERFGAVPVLGTALLAGAAATAAIGFFAQTVGAVSAVEAASCFFVGLGSAGSIGLATLVYPTALRSTGLGWAMAMGRFGQVGATLLTGMAVGRGWGSVDVFLALAAAPLLGAVSVAAMHRHTRRLAAAAIPA